MIPTPKIVIRNTFSIIFFIRRKKTNKDGDHPIYCKVTVQGKSREFSTQIWVSNTKWDVRTSSIIGSNEFSKTKKYQLDNIKLKLGQIRGDLLSQNKEVTADSIVDKYSGKEQRKYSLIDVHQSYNERVKKLIGNGYSSGTYNRYETSLSHIQEFIDYNFQRKDIYLDELRSSFAADYNFYLRTKRNCANNTSMKYIANLKATLNFAVIQGWITTNPLSGYRKRMEKIEKQPLTLQELHILENKNFDNSRLQEVRDVFVFCCYTGLSYSDSAKLNSKHIILDLNTGDEMIHIYRTKTNGLSRIPLLPKAKSILETYRNNEYCIFHKRLLPTRSNQKQNEYLKEIANLCGINKTLTTHIARHTFATIMITYGAKMETVSQMLGHSNLNITQHYGKVTDQKIRDDLKSVEEKLTG